MKWLLLTTKDAAAPTFGRFAYTSFRDSNSKLKFIVTDDDSFDKDKYVYDVETSTWTKYIRQKGDLPQTIKTWKWPTLKASCT
jgi:hypothetical protein